MSDPAQPLISPDEALRRYFDTASFRPGQREAVESVVAGRDTLAIMPTGSGKSLIYQAAALALPGTALIVSPLIALMRHQVTRLHERGVRGVAALHSQVPESEQRAALDALARGDLRLLYVTPERCTDPGFLEAARHATISLLAVDEAHCISEWGHDFRPAYLLLDDAARALGRPPIVALTATATPWVRDEIVARLGLNDPRVIVRGFDRPNLFYEVYRAGTEDEKHRALLRVLTDGREDYPGPRGPELERAAHGSGIVYTALTASARGLSQWLNRNGVHAAYYHGRLRAAQRNAVQDRFREGHVRAIAATNAFGMGIDRADLRFVAHFDTPPSLEAYYQESGRAGRDGGIARCALIYREEDLGRAAFAGGAGAVDEEALERVMNVLDSAGSRGIMRDTVAKRSGLPPVRTLHALEALLRVEAAREHQGRYRAGKGNGDRLQRALAFEQRRREHDRTRLDMVRAYVQAGGCRRQFLLRYFGEYDAPNACGMCDRCVPRAGQQPRSAAGTPAQSAPFQPGDRVHHATWGEGIVEQVGASTLTARFTDAGYRTLDQQTVIEGGLLQPAAQRA